MDQAKAAVSKIVGRSGQHDTEVHETVNPAVTQEVVKPHRHEETTQAVDREVHQDHYHTTVQPLQHKEVLPEKHAHQTMPIQEREISHGDDRKIRSSVEAEAAKFANTSTTHQTTHSTSQGAVQAGEHVHHHVHETVQPIVHKETVQPEVVHTVIPIHETHHAQAEHHGLSTLPTKTLSEFKELGGKVTGQSHRHEEYEGHPRPYNPSMQQTRTDVDVNPKSHDGLHGSHGNHGLTGTSGTTGGLTGTSGSHTGGLTGTSGSHTGGLTNTSGSHTGGLTNTSGSHTGGLTGTSGSHTGTSGGLTGTSGTHSHTGGLSGTHGSNVSGSGLDYSTGSGPTSGGLGSTGTALGGRTEGNTASRALDAATSHGSTGHTGITGTSGIGTHDTSSRGLESSTTGHTSTGGIGSHSDRGITDTSSSTNADPHGTARGRLDDVQSPRQGKDPNLVEDISNTKSSSGLRGEGVDGSHSAVFGLTPDGHKHNNTSHQTTAPRPAHSKDRGNNAATGDTGSRAAVGGGVASQLNDPRVSEGAHGYDTSNTGSAKIGAGAPGGEQGFGNVRPKEHGATERIENKLDPTTDADGDGKRGLMD